jgi:hypothetical protein
MSSLAPRRRTCHTNGTVPSSYVLQVSLKDAFLYLSMNKTRCTLYSALTRQHHFPDTNVDGFRSGGAAVRGSWSTFSRTRSAIQGEREGRVLLLLKGKQLRGECLGLGLTIPESQGDYRPKLSVTGGTARLRSSHWSIRLLERVENVK